MTEAKGSDVRAAYVDTGTPKCPVCQMPMNGSVECHLPSCTLRVLQEEDVETRVQAAAKQVEVEIALLRGRLRTIGMAGEFGHNSEIVNRLRELENRDDQCRQYIQQAQEREHHRNECEARVQAAAVEMQERCAKTCNDLIRKAPTDEAAVAFALAAETVRQTSIPTNAYDAALLRRDAIFKWLLGENGEFAARPEGGGAYWWRTELRQRLAALTQPAPERKEK